VLLDVEVLQLDRDRLSEGHVAEQLAAARRADEGDARDAASIASVDTPEQRQRHAGDDTDETTTVDNKTTKVNTPGVMLHEGVHARMIRQSLFLTIITTAAVAGGVSVSAQLSEASARDQARSAVRSHLALEPDGFLAVERDEKLEQSVDLVAGRRGVFIYRTSQAGDDYLTSQAGDDRRRRTVVHHIVMDGDPTHIVAISAADGSVYRIHGFADSRAEFDRLIATMAWTISNSDQAGTVADFYREVNPDNWQMAPIVSLIDLKQSAERQCQKSTFDVGEQEFDAWWKRGKALYSAIPFQQVVTPGASGYVVEWTILSSSALGMCGGAPLRARLEVGSDGRVGKGDAVPLIGAGLGHEAGRAPSTAVH
jgi:hypothetical protein